MKRHQVHQDISRNIVDLGPLRFLKIWQFVNKKLRSCKFMYGFQTHQGNIAFYFKEKYSTAVSGSMSEFKYRFQNSVNLVVIVPLLLMSKLATSIISIVHCHLTFHPKADVSHLIGKDILGPRRKVSQEKYAPNTLQLKIVLL